MESSDDEYDEHMNVAPAWMHTALNGQVRAFSRSPSSFPQNLSLLCERGSACHRALFCCLNASEQWYNTEQQIIEVLGDDKNTYTFVASELRKCCEYSNNGSVMLKGNLDAASVCEKACDWHKSQALPHAFWWHHDGRAAVRYAALRSTLADSIHLLLNCVFLLKQPPKRLDGDLLTATLRHKCCAWGFRHERVREFNHDVLQLHRVDKANDGSPFEFCQGTHEMSMPTARCPVPRTCK